MDQLDQLALFHIATMLDLNDLLSLCSSNSRINRLICQQDAIWKFKLNNEFPDWRQHFDGKLPRKIYNLLVKLTKLRKEIDYTGSIYQLYQETKLDLSNRNLKTLPPEIGSLSNLRELSLYNNKLKTLPPEIGLLSNLQDLDLYSNRIETLPPEIGSLSNLRHLYLNDNEIEVLPPEIGLLTNLERLFLQSNQIVTLPSEISYLTKLNILYLDKTVNAPPNLKNIITYKTIKRF